MESQWRDYMLLFIFFYLFSHKRTEDAGPSFYAL